MSVLGTSYLPLINGFYFTLYYLEIPFLEQFKVQKGKLWPWKKEPHRWRQILVNAFSRAFFNNIVVIMIGLTGLCYMYDW